MKFHERLLPYGEALLRMIYPSRCGVCEAFLELEETGLCGACASRLAALKFAPDQAVVRENFESLDEVWALYPYESPVKETIAAIKFSKKRWLVRLFTEEVKSLALAMAGETFYDAVVPIPIAREKLMEREFNQAELIARLIAHWAGLPVKTVLRKHRETFPQSRLGQEERRTNLDGIFSASGRGLKGKTFLLVDDIFTTGATAREGARCLKSRGAKRVDLFALARTVHRS